MNRDYETIIGAGDGDRHDLFLAAATALGTTLQNVEKDFWVCWALDLLFNGLPAEAPRLLFKGGTSLSKGFGLISRFSEDIDVTVFRDDLGEDASLEALEAMSGKKRQARLDAIKEKASAYINGPLKDGLEARIAEALAAAGADAGRFRVEPDPDDGSAQTLLLWYPTIVADRMPMSARPSRSSQARSLRSTRTADTSSRLMCKGTLPASTSVSPTSPRSSRSAPSGTRS